LHQQNEKLITDQGLELLNRQMPEFTKCISERRRATLVQRPFCADAGFARLSTLMSGRMPWFERTWTSGVPSELF
jgi:hypothetical protein